MQQVLEPHPRLLQQQPPPPGPQPQPAQLRACCAQPAPAAAGAARRASASRVWCAVAPPLQQHPQRLLQALQCMAPLPQRQLRWRHHPPPPLRAPAHEQPACARGAARALQAPPPGSPAQRAALHLSCSAGLLVPVKHLVTTCPSVRPGFSGYEAAKPRWASPVTPRRWHACMTECPHLGICSQRKAVAADTPSQQRPPCCQQLPCQAPPRPRRSPHAARSACPHPAPRAPASRSAPRTRAAPRPACPRQSAAAHPAPARSFSPSWFYAALLRASQCYGAGAVECLLRRGRSLAGRT